MLTGPAAFAYTFPTERLVFLCWMKNKLDTGTYTLEEKLVRERHSMEHGFLRCVCNSLLEVLVWQYLDQVNTELYALVMGFGRDHAWVSKHLDSLRQNNEVDEQFTV